jgi:tripartite-type tricarboxylate transporter receptor subunit TctC
MVRWDRMMPRDGRRGGPELPRRRLVATALASAGLTLVGGAAAAAEPYPTAPLRIVVPFAAGGVADIIARLLADKLDQRLGQRVLVDNRPGAGGSIGTAQVARAAPDGYTLLMASPGHTVNPSIQPDLSWDPVRDFAPVTKVATIPNVIVVNAKSTVRSVADLLTLARAQPERVTFGSAGIASSNHLAGELLNSMAGTKMVHVPYKGQNEALQDLLAERIIWIALTATLAAPHIESGALRAIAVTTPARSPLLPETPTVAEQGMTGFDVSPWIALYLPAKVDQAIVDRLNLETRRVLGLEDVRERFRKLGAEPVGDSAEELAAFTRADRDRWANIVRDAGIRAN